MRWGTGTNSSSALTVAIAGRTNVKTNSLLLFLATGSTLFGASKLSRDLQNLPPSTKLDVIVQFTAPPSATQ